MRINYYFSILLSALLILGSVAQAEVDPSGQVQLPLNTYNNLVDTAREPNKEPRPAPAPYVLGRATVSAEVIEVEDNSYAKVTTQLEVQVLEDEWISVPILPAGTPISEAVINGQSVQLISSGEGLSWGVKQSGSYSMKLVYNIDAKRYESGYAVAIPLPKAAAVSFRAIIPGHGLDAALIPSAGLKIDSNTQQTTVSATIPTSSGVQLSWRAPRKEGHSVSRAQYKGVETDDSISWEGLFDVELFSDETVALKLLPQSATLKEILVDKEHSNIVVEQGYFAALVKGRGAHTIKVGFKTPVVRDDGPPSVDVTIPEIPISHFELQLEGGKEVTVSPYSEVSSEALQDSTLVSVYVPMTNKVRFSWSEAIPEEVKAEVRANASIYHSVYAEEGVLNIDALVIYEITRGSLKVVELEIPDGVQINRVGSPQNLIADWRVAMSEEQKKRVLSVFLDREVEKALTLAINYDQSIVGKESSANIRIPLLQALKVNRQRGMAAMLSTKELTLKPIQEERVTKVGENQLPAQVRQSLNMTVAHTYKYVESSPVIIVQAAEPEKKQGKFDALVQTLISLGDVTLKALATCEVNVKSGKIMELRLKLPKEVNLLNLTGPSIRSYKVVGVDDNQEVEVQFTQEMEGQFRLEAAYEHIMTEGSTLVDVPTLEVVGAEAKTGYIAVEALAAVEVQQSAVERLSPMQTNELPLQLVQKTTNPILLAYKYVTVPPSLSLEVTRHKVIDVQAAAIDQARYSTLILEDGLVVTSATFKVRNSRKQFLRVNLPQDASVWSVTVDGKPEKPAIAENREEGAHSGKSVLIKVINSVNGFSISLVYQSRIPRLGFIGAIESSLPTPDMVATFTRWEIYLPSDFAYGRLDTNLNSVETDVLLSKSAIARELTGLAEASGADSVLMNIPTAGKRYVFEKLYANQTDDDAYFSLFYFSEHAHSGALVAVVLGTMLIWLVVSAIAKLNLSLFVQNNLRRTFVVAVALLVFVIWYLQLAGAWVWAVRSSIVCAVALAAMLRARRLRERKGSPSEPEVKNVVSETDDVDF